MLPLQEISLKRAIVCPQLVSAQPPRKPSQRGIDNDADVGCGVCLCGGGTSCELRGERAYDGGTWVVARINETRKTAYPAAMKLGGLTHGVMGTDSPARPTQEVQFTLDGSPHSPFTHLHPGAIRSLKQTCREGGGVWNRWLWLQRSRSADQSFGEILTHCHNR